MLANRFNPLTCHHIHSLSPSLSFSLSLFFLFSFFFLSFFRNLRARVPDLDAGNGCATTPHAPVGPLPLSPRSLSRAMSWQAYVDQQLLGTGTVTKAAIYGLDGGCWATSPGFGVSFFMRCFHVFKVFRWRVSRGSVRDAGAGRGCRAGDGGRGYTGVQNTAARRPPARRRAGTAAACFWEKKGKKKKRRKDA